MQEPSEDKCKLYHCLNQFVVVCTDTIRAILMLRLEHGTKAPFIFKLRHRQRGVILCETALGVHWI